MTVAPAARAWSAVSSVEPSSTTRTGRCSSAPANDVARSADPRCSPGSARRRGRASARDQARSSTPVPRSPSTRPIRHDVDARRPQVVLDGRHPIRGDRREQPAGCLRVVGEGHELRRDAVGDGQRRARRTGGCGPRRRSRRRPARDRARRRAPAGPPRRRRTASRTPGPSRARAQAARTRSRRSRRRCRGGRGPRRRPGSASASGRSPAARSPADALPWRLPLTSSPVPSRFVRISTSPGRAPPLRSSRSGCPAPMTARPYFGSGSRIVWPPASVPPASRTFDAAPSKTAASVSRGSSSGNAAIDSAKRTRPPIANTSLSAFAAAISPNVRASSTSGGKKSSVRDDREVVGDPVRGRVVGRREAGDQLVGRRLRHRARRARRPAGPRRASPRSRRSRSARSGGSAEGQARHGRSHRRARVVGAERRRRATIADAGASAGPGAAPVFKTGDAALGAAWWVRLPCAPATRSIGEACRPRRDAGHRASTRSSRPSARELRRLDRARRAGRRRAVGRRGRARPPRRRAPTPSSVEPLRPTRPPTDSPRSATSRLRRSSTRPASSSTRTWVARRGRRPPSTPRPPRPRELPPARARPRDRPARRRASAAPRTHLVALTGAEDALVTNNNAAAAGPRRRARRARRGVAVSRGELVEIGGGVRIPEIVRRAGARLVEVGTTNRTRAADFEAPLADGRASARPPRPPLELPPGAGSPRRPTPPRSPRSPIAHGAIVVDDLGSGALLDTSAFGLAHEPTPSRAPRGRRRPRDVQRRQARRRAAGRARSSAARDLVARLRRDPLARAMRPDKATLAAVAATLGPLPGGPRRRPRSRSGG